MSFLTSVMSKASLHPTLAAPQSLRNKNKKPIPKADGFFRRKRQADLKSFYSSSQGRRTLRGFRGIPRILINVTSLNSKDNTGKQNAISCVLLQSWEVSS